MQTITQITKDDTFSGHTFILSEHYPNSQGINYLVRTGAKTVGVNGEIKTTNDGHLEVWEDVTVTNNGTEISLYNANRTSSVLPLTKIYTAPTYSGGTRIINGMISDKNKEGNRDLPPCLAFRVNTNYVIRVIAPQATDFSIFLSLME